MASSFTEIAATLLVTALAIGAIPALVYFFKAIDARRDDAIDALAFFFMRFSDDDLVKMHEKILSSQRSNRKGFGSKELKELHAIRRALELKRSPRPAEGAIEKARSQQSDER